MKLQTPVELPERTVQLTPHSHVMMVGSCFAEHMGRRLAECLCANRICVNPNGVLYNPGSLCRTLTDLATSPTTATDDLLFQAADGLWHHWLYSTQFTAPQKDELLQMLRAHAAKARTVFEQMDVLCITFSTDHAYYLAQGVQQGTLVANCHKQPARLFNEQILDPDDLYNRWSHLLLTLQRRNAGLKVVFTLSPYRYEKYGMHENALSKARQLLLIDRLCRNHDNATYFPAYEIVTDELRDYRFYEADMLHPSAQATGYVWERFTEWAFTPQLKEYAAERGQLLRAVNHRPLHPESNEYKRFREQLEEKKRRFEKKWGESME